MALSSRQRPGRRARRAAASIGAIQSICRCHIRASPQQRFARSRVVPPVNSSRRAMPWRMAHGLYLRRPSTLEDPMRDVTFPNGRNVPALGQGTWLMGEDASDAAEESKALLAGIDAGLTLIDTAEMYGDGATRRPSWERSWPGAATRSFSSARPIRKMPRAPVSRPPAKPACGGSPRTISTSIFCTGRARSRSPRRSRPWKRLSRAARLAPGASAISMSPTLMRSSKSAERGARPTRCSTTSRGVVRNSTSSRG